MSLLLVFLGSLSLAAAWVVPPSAIEEADIHFERFIEVHQRKYIDENEKQARFEIFKENLIKFTEMNERSTHTNFGITQFMDLTAEEFSQTYTNLKVPNVTEHGCHDLSDYDIPDAGAPESHDWRNHGAVTAIKNQLSCGSCYAFSAVGNIEGQYYIKHRQQLDLSEQQIVDCDKQSNGCSGGYMASAFRSIIDLGGIESESTYPYANQQQQCRFSASRAVVRLQSCNSYNIVSQEKLKQVLYSVGPISVAVKASNFQAYTGGVMMDEFCNSGQVNHAVLLVGYGTQSNGTPYWIAKNSWGTSFGEGGYFRMLRGENAHSCGMMNNRLMSSSVVQ